MTAASLSQAKDLASGLFGTFHEPTTIEEANLVRRVNYAAVSINSLLNAVAMYTQDYGENPYSAEELVDLEYISFSKPTTLWWKFVFSEDSSEIAKIFAIGTEANKDATGDTLAYDIATGEYSGKLAKMILPEVMSRLIETPIYIQHIQGARASDTTGTIVPKSDYPGTKSCPDKP